MISRHKTIRGRLLVRTYHATLPISLWKPLVFWCSGATYRSSDPCMPTYSPQSMHPLIPIFRSLMPFYFPQSVHPLMLMNEHARASFTFLCLLCFSLTVTSSGSFFLTLTTWSCSISPTIWTDTVVIPNIRIMHSKHPGHCLAHSSSINTSQSDGCCH